MHTQIGIAWIERRKDCLKFQNSPYYMPQASEFKGKKFQAAQLTHERFLTIDHSFKIFFDICQTELPPTSGV